MSTKQIDAEEQEQVPAGDSIRRRQVKRETIAMEDFFEVNDIEKSTQDMFVEYNKNGEGCFTKNEVLNIITDLKKSSHHNQELAATNKMMKKMLYGAVVFFFLLVGSLFGVSVAVAVLTKETSVQDGTLYNKEGSAIVATDSRADLFDVETFDFGDCLSLEDIESIKSHVEAGKNVIVSRHQEGGASHQLEMLSPSGATYNDETGVACYPMPEKPNKVYCLFPNSKACEAVPDSRRHLGPSASFCERKPDHQHCQAAAACECDIVPTCLSDMDDPATWPADASPMCSDHACMLEPCTFTCPTLGTEVGDPCSCEGTFVCQNVAVEDCSNCNV